MGSLSSSIFPGEKSQAHVGSSCSHNGRSATFTALNGASQQHLLRQAGDINASHLEAHGTGTALGDPVELGALAGIFSSKSASVASIKGNLGHVEGAAGAAGLLNLSNALWI